MKKFTYVLILSAMAFSSYAQKKQKTELTGDLVGHASEFLIQRSVFKQALAINDLNVATQALHVMVALQPQNHGLRDSLAFLYFNGGAHVQVVLLGKQILEQDPDKTEILELVAASEQSLGAIKEALTDYETLFTSSKEMYHLYQIASLQYSLKRFGECAASVDRILADPDAPAKKVKITIGQGQSQDVPLNAAAINMKGVIALDMKKLEEAKGHFSNALKIYPEFQLAKMNLESIEKSEEPAK